MGQDHFWRSIKNIKIILQENANTKKIVLVVNSNLQSIGPKAKALPLSQVGLTEETPIKIVLENCLKITKYAFTQKALDAFWFFASISFLLTISQLFCFIKVVLEITCIICCLRTVCTIIRQAIAGLAELLTEKATSCTFCSTAH